MNYPKPPTFAVVGRVNEGKSSLVAALTENDAIAIGPDPGTTRLATPYHLEDGGERLLTVIDTPGFQEPEAVFAWLSVHARTAAERPAAIRAFLEAFADDERFADERRLLQPVMDGASVLYVVDASHPFRPSYELEMQILRWTGRPCFALVNHTRASDYFAQWQASLQQYFNAVRPFNAQQNRFEDRLGLLTLLAELEIDSRPALLRAAESLRERQRRRHERAAGAITDVLFDLVGFTLKTAPGDSDEATKRRVETQFHSAIAQREEQERLAVEAIFAHRRVKRVESSLEPPLFDRDIFSEDVWQLLGQTKLKLVGAGALGGALLGGTIDALTLGHSFLAGTLLGGGLGGLGSAFAAFKAPEAKVLGVAISGTETVVGPHRNPNFAWILLDRALLHAQAVAQRAHSAQAPLQADGRQGVVGSLSATDTAKIEVVFRELRSGKRKAESREELTKRIAGVLARL